MRNATGLHHNTFCTGGARRKDAPEIYLENIRLKEQLGRVNGNDEESPTLTVLDMLEQLHKDQEDIKTGIIKNKYRKRVIDINIFIFYF